MTTEQSERFLQVIYDLIRDRGSFRVLCRTLLDVKDEDERYALAAEVSYIIHIAAPEFPIDNVLSSVSILFLDHELTKSILRAQLFAANYRSRKR